MTNGSTLLVENDAIFSAISQLNYSFYEDDETAIRNALQRTMKIFNVLLVYGHIAFGQAQ